MVKDKGKEKVFLSFLLLMSFSWLLGSCVSVMIALYRQGNKDTPRNTGAWSQQKVPPASACLGDMQLKLRGDEGQMVCGRNTGRALLWDWKAPAEFLATWVVLALHTFTKD